VETTCRSKPSKKLVGCARSLKALKEASPSPVPAPPPDPKNDLAASFGHRCPHHSHSLGLIQLLLCLVLNSAVGFRSAAAALKVVSLLFPTTGIVPCEILSDCGADLQKGISQFRSNHPQTRGVKDIAHAAASAVKQELNECYQSSRYANSFTYAALAFQGSPHKAKSKARAAVACSIPRKLN
jgi:hypothetical protein